MPHFPLSVPGGSADVGADIISINQISQGCLVGTDGGRSSTHYNTSRIWRDDLNQVSVG